MHEKKYGQNTIYIISYAEIPKNMAAASIHKYAGIGFIIDTKKNVIIDTSCTYLTEEAKKFIKDILVGHNLKENGIEPMVEQFKTRFFGPSQKTICTILRDNYNKYLNFLHTSSAVHKKS